MIKAPLFRGIDVCSQVLAVLPAAREGLPFREAYRRVAAEIANEKGAGKS